MAELYVNSNYNSSTDGWGESKFSSLDAALKAAITLGGADIVLEDQTLASDNLQKVVTKMHGASGMNFSITGTSAGNEFIAIEMRNSGSPEDFTELATLVIKDANLNCYKVAAYQNSKITIDNSVIDFHSDQSGPLYTKGNGELYITNSNIKNTTQISAMGTLMSFDNSTLESGSAIQISGEMKFDNDSTFTLSSAKIYGGTGVLTIEDSTMVRKALRTAQDKANALVYYINGKANIPTALSEYAYCVVVGGSQYSTTAHTGTGVMNVTNSTFDFSAEYAEKTYASVEGYENSYGMVAVGLGSQLNITANSIFNVDLLMNEGSITIDATSKLTADELNNTGTITIDAANYTGSNVKIIDLNQDAPLTGVSLVNANGYFLLYGNDGDVTLAKNTPDTIYVSSDYNSTTEGWDYDRFSTYSSAYAHAVANGQTSSTIVIEKTNTLSGNTFDNNHKNYSNIAVVINDGASLGNALSKWDMTYAVTVEAGGKLEMARPLSANVSNVHLKNTLTIGVAGEGQKVAVLDFLSDSYQDGDISIRYNGKMVANNAEIYVQDLDAQGAMTLTDTTLVVDGALATAAGLFAPSTNFTRVTATINGTQISGGLSDFAGGSMNQLGNFTMTDSTVTFGNGSQVKVAANIKIQGESTLTVDALTINSGKKITMDYTSTLAFNNITNNGSISIATTGFSGTNKILDYTGTGTMTEDAYKAILNTEWHDNYKVINNDLYLTDADLSTIYVNSAWAGKEVGTEVETGTGKYFGINAFANSSDAFKAANKNSGAVIDLTAEEYVYADALPDSEAYNLLITNAGTYTITGGDGLLINYEVEINPDKAEAAYIVNWNDAKVTMTKLTLRDSVTATIEDSIMNFKGYLGNGTMSGPSYLSVYRDSTLEIKNSTVGLDISRGDGKFDDPADEVTGDGIYNNFGAAWTVYGALSVTDSTIYAGTAWGNDSFVLHKGATASLTNTTIHAVHLNVGYFNPDEKKLNEERTSDSASLVLDNSKFYNTMYQGDGGSTPAGLLVGSSSNTIANTATLKNNSVVDMTLNGSVYGYANDKGLYVGNAQSSVSIESGSQLIVSTATNNGTVNVSNSTLVVEGTMTNNGTFTVSGTSTVKITSLTGEEVEFLDGAIIKDSTIGGGVFVAGNVTFKGDNSFGMLYDYGTLTDYYGTTAPMAWTVEAGASLILTDKARYGLGYGDKVVINGEIAANGAAAARAALTAVKSSLFMHGLVAQESSGWNCDSSFTVNNAYVTIGSNNSFGNKPGNYGGTYTFLFDNAVLDASRITFYEALSKTTFTFKDSDVKTGTFMTRDADSVFTLQNTTLISNTTTNGTDEGNYHAGTLNLQNSMLQYAASVKNESGIINITDSTLIAPAIENNGTINVSGTSTVKIDSLTGSNRVNVAADATLVDSNIGGSINMLGDLTIENGLTLSGGLWASNGGTLSGDTLNAYYAMFQTGTYTINADLELDYGYLSFGGTFTVSSTIHTTGTSGEVLYINGDVDLLANAKLDCDNGLFINYAGASLDVLAGAAVDTAGTLKIVADTELNISYGSTITAGSVTNDGTINFTAGSTYKGGLLIDDADGAGSTYGTVNITVEGQSGFEGVVINGDLYAVNMTAIYVDYAWATTTAVGTRVGEGMYYGINAFSSLEAITPELTVGPCTVYFDYAAADVAGLVVTVKGETTITNYTFDKTAYSVLNAQTREHDIELKFNSTNSKYEFSGAFNFTSGDFSFKEIKPIAKNPETPEGVTPGSGVMGADGELVQVGGVSGDKSYTFTLDAISDFDYIISDIEGTGRLTLTNKTTGEVTTRLFGNNGTYTLNDLSAGSYEATFSGYGLINDEAEFNAKFEFVASNMDLLDDDRAYANTVNFTGSEVITNEIGKKGSAVVAEDIMDWFKITNMTPAADGTLVMDFAVEGDGRGSQIIVNVYKVAAGDTTLQTIGGFVVNDTVDTGYDRTQKFYGVSATDTIYVQVFGYGQSDYSINLAQPTSL